MGSKKRKKVHPGEAYLRQWRVHTRQVPVPLLCPAHDVASLGNGTSKSICESAWNREEAPVLPRKWQSEYASAG